MPITISVSAAIFLLVFVLAVFGATLAFTFFLLKSLVAPLLERTLTTRDQPRTQDSYNTGWGAP